MEDPNETVTAAPDAPSEASKAVKVMSKAGGPATVGEAQAEQERRRKEMKRQLKAGQDGGEETGKAKWGVLAKGVKTMKVLKSTANTLAFEPEDEVNWLEINKSQTAADRGTEDPWVRIRVMAKRITKGRWSRLFDSFIGFVILTNAVTIGIEVQQKIDCTEPKREDCTVVIQILEGVFLLVYATELALHLIAYKWRAFEDNWVKADAFFVGMGLIDLIINVSKVDLSLFSPVMLLRTLRLARLARPLRLFYQFQEMWTLVSGLLASAGTIFYTLVMILVIIYIFACLAVELITKPGSDHSGEPPGYSEVRETYFPSLTVSMLTLTQFIAIDSVGGLYKPLIEGANSSNMDQLIMLVYFSTLILIVSVVLMNLIIAVVIDGAISSSSSDRDTQRKQEQGKKAKLVADLEDIFIKLDADGSGMIDYHEVKGGPRHAKDILCELVEADDVKHVFHNIHLDPDKEHDRGEFMKKITDYISYDGDKPMRRCEGGLAKLNARMDQLENCLNQLSLKNYGEEIETVYAGMLLASHCTGGFGKALGMTVKPGPINLPASPSNGPATAPMDRLESPSNGDRVKKVSKKQSMQEQQVGSE